MIPTKAASRSPSTSAVAALTSREILDEPCLPQSESDKGGADGGFRDRSLDENKVDCDTGSPSGAVGLILPRNGKG